MFYMLYSKYFFKYLFINYEINLNIKLRNQSIFIKKIKKLILLKLYKNYLITMIILIRHSKIFRFCKLHNII